MPDDVAPSILAAPVPATVTGADLASLPKVELHVHLGGSITEATALELCHRHGGDPASDLRLVDGRYPGRYADFGGFLDAFLASNQFVRTPDDLALVAERFARGQAAQGIVYSEVIFTAMIYARNGMDRHDMWAALRSGFAAGGDTTRIGLIVDVIRDLGRAEARATLDLIADADAPIVGLGLTGVEGTVPTSEFLELRGEARRMGLGFEVHAGEMGPPSSVTESLDVLEADRIGHGVASARDPQLVERLVRDGVVLEVCPSSNVAVGLYPSLDDHPFRALWEAGVRVTVSSDDPPFFATTLPEELRRVSAVAGLSREDIVELQRRAAAAAFLPPGDRAGLRQRIDDWARRKGVGARAGD
jgi:adenosine deaminase